MRLIASGSVRPATTSNSDPPISTRSKKLSYDKELHRGRNRIERFFNKIKLFRRIAARYDKLHKTFFAAVCLVAAFLIADNS